MLRWQQQESGRHQLLQYERGTGASPRQAAAAAPVQQPQQPAAAVHAAGAALTLGPARFGVQCQQLRERPLQAVRGIQAGLGGGREAAGYFN